MKRKQMKLMGLSMAIVLAAVSGGGSVSADTEQEMVTEMSDGETEAQDIEDLSALEMEEDIAIEMGDMQELEAEEILDAEPEEQDAAEESFAVAVQDAENSDVYDSGSLNDEKTINWILYKNGRLVIEGTGKIPDVTECSLDFRLERTQMTSVEIGEGITGIGNEVFMNCSNLTSVTLPTTLTSIGSSVFEKCTGLISVSFPERMSNISIGAQAFAGCTNLEQVEINGDQRTVGEYAFQNCSRLKKVTIEKGATLLREGAFQNCTSLEEVVTGDDSGVALIENYSKFALSGCINLKSIKISGRTSTIPQAAFDGCSSLQSISIPDSVKTIAASAFHNCAGLTSVTIPDTVETVQEQAFAGCTGLKEVVMKDGTAKLRVEKNAFAGCSNLEEITISQRAILGEQVFTDYKSVKVIRYTGTREEGNAAGLNKYDFYNADIYYEYKEAHEHKFVTYSIKYTDSCIEPGKSVTKCKICGEIRSEEEIPAQGHDWEVTGEVKATCIAQGTQNLKCKRCGETTTRTTPLTGHTFSDWETTTAATVFAPAVQTRTCSVCGQKETRNFGNKLPATMKFNVTKLPLKTKQKTTVLKATGFAEGDSIVSWKSNNAKIVKVSGKANGSCTLTAGSKTGKATITVTLKSGAKKTVTVTVQKKAVKTSKISGVTKKLNLKKNQKATLTATVTPLTSQQKVTYKSSNSKVATVTSKGVVRAKKKGTAVISVKSGSKTVKCKVTVK